MGKCAKETKRVQGQTALLKKKDGEEHGSEPDPRTFVLRILRFANASAWLCTTSRADSKVKKKMNVT